MTLTKRLLTPLLAAAALALAALAAAPAVAPAAACSDDTSKFSAVGVDAVAAAVVCLTNVERTARGLAALRSDSHLAAAARAHSREMARYSFFSHTGRNGSSVAERVIAAGYDYRTAGENIAAGYPTARAVVLGWMRSKGHCQNILRPSFGDIGVGIATSDDAYGVYFTQDFGSRRALEGSNAPMAGCPYDSLSEGAAGSPADERPTCRGRAAGKLRLTSARRSSRTRVRVGGRLTAQGCCPKVRFSVKRGGRTKNTTKRLCARKFVVTLRAPSGSGRARISARVSGSGAKASRTTR